MLSAFDRLFTEYSQKYKKDQQKKFLLAKYLLLGSSIAFLKQTTSRLTYKYSHVYYPKENNSKIIMFSFG